MLKLALVLSFIFLLNSIPMKLHLQDISTGARCLDGSPAALYYAQGQESEKTVLFFQGGGYCSGDALSVALQNCYKRSKTVLGSSKMYPQTLESDDAALLSSDADINPLYYNWNKVFIPYCDGTLHQGSALQPVSYKGVNLYFRGSNNSIAAFNFINQTFNLFGSESVVLTGTSAGGMAVYYWGNYLYHRLTNKNNLLLVPDSGIFFSSFSQTPDQSKIQLNRQGQKWSSKFLGQKQDIRGIFGITNRQTMMPIQECVKLHPQQTPCFNTGDLDAYIIPPLYIIEPLYDEYALKNILGIKCVSSGVPGKLDNCSTSELAIIQKYRQSSVATLKKYALNVKNGVWGIACIIHTFTGETDIVNSQSWKTPIKNPNLKAKTLLEVLAGFVLRSGSRQLIDSVAYPNNEACNGIKAPQLSI